MKGAGDGWHAFVYAAPMSVLQRLLILIVAVLAVAALVGLMKHDIGRNAAPPSPASAADGGFWSR